MTVDDQMSAQARVAGPAQDARGRARELARRTLWRFAPALARRRSAKVGLAATVQRLQADFEHTSKRHDERIERLEDLARELVATAESLRREIAARDRRDGG
jgi:hypothetical protein